MPEKKNYCRLIGLNPTKESKYNAQAIEKKIADREAKWKKESSNKQNGVEKRYEFKCYLDEIPKIRETFQNSSTKALEFEEGRRLLRSKASKLTQNSVILHDGTRLLMPGSAETLLKKLQWDDVTKDDLITLSGMKVNAPTKVVGAKIENAYKAIRGAQAYTPSEVLNRLINNKKLEIDAPQLSDTSPLSQLRSAFEICDKRVNNVKQDVLPEADTYITTLRNIKMVLSTDKDLGELIKYGKCQRALKPALEEMDEDNGDQFSRKYIDNLLKTYMREGGNERAMAIAILEDYCVKKKYPANFSEKESKLSRCSQCQGFIETGPQIRCCPICGHGIYVKCPQCKTEQSSDNRACSSCGFDFEKGLKNANDLANRFKTNLRLGQIDKAKTNLEDLKKTFSSYPDIETLNMNLRAATFKYDSALKAISTAEKLRNYCEEKDAIENALIDFPKLLDDNFTIKKQYEEAKRRIKTADELCIKAEKAETKDVMILTYADAADQCPDHPVAKSKMREYPPESPADATVQAREGKVLVRYAVPEDRKGMSFCIFRSKNGIPNVTDNTIPLTEISGSVYLDKQLEPGVEYYYSIYSRRWGILSREAAMCGPIMVFIEVEDVTLEPYKDGIRILYEKPKGCNRVRIWRKEGATAAGVGEEVEIIHGGEGVYDDLGLKGGVTYHYLFVAEYPTKGGTERSLGTDFSCTTIKCPEPVRDMEIKWNKSDGSFTAKWKTKEPVYLYSSPKNLKLAGRTSNLEDLDRWMKKLVPLETYDNGARFNLPDGAAQYIYPVIPMGKMGVRGKEVLVANLRPFRDVERRISGNDCDICMTWPADAESAQVVIKDDAPATSVDDITAERITITREAYDKDKRIRISMGHSNKRVVTIYAAYDVAGKKMYSRGINMDIYSGACNKVHYDITMERIKAVITIDTDSTMRKLPPMKAVCVKEGIPLRIWDGEAVWTSQTDLPLAAGRTTISFPVKPKTDPKRIRLFFVDENDYNLFRFIHPIFKD